MGIFKRKVIDREAQIERMQKQEPYPECRWCGTKLAIVTDYFNKKVPPYFRKICHCDNPTKLGDLEQMEKRIMAAITTNPPPGSKNDA